MSSLLPWQPSWWAHWVSARKRHSRLRYDCTAQREKTDRGNSRHVYSNMDSDIKRGFQEGTHFGRIVNVLLWKYFGWIIFKQSGFVWIRTLRKFPLSLRRSHVEAGETVSRWMYVWIPVNTETVFGSTPQSVEQNLFEFTSANNRVGLHMFYEVQ